MVGVGIINCLFATVQDFFEPDEYWNTSTPLQSTGSHCDDALSNAKTDRTPLTQICDQTVVSGDNYKSFISSRDSLPVTSNSSSQKLKTFSFSRCNRNKVTDLDGLPPPSKKPASEKELARLSSSSQQPSTPNITAQVNSFISTMTNSVSGGSSVMKSSTPTMTPSNKHKNETPSLPVTPVSCRSATKRKFPGPAGLLPKLVRKLFLCLCIYVQSGLFD